MPVRVLVVEDDFLIREMLVDTLSDEGFEVVHAADGDEALSRCRERAGNVLVIDVVMPGGIDGWQVAEQCQAHHPNLAVI